MGRRACQAGQDARRAGEVRRGTQIRAELGGTEGSARRGGEAEELIRERSPTDGARAHMPNDRKLGPASGESRPQAAADGFRSISRKRLILYTAYPLLPPHRAAPHLSPGPSVKLKEAAMNSRTTIGGHREIICSQRQAPTATDWRDTSGPTPAHISLPALCESRSWRLRASGATRRDMA